MDDNLVLRALMGAAGASVLAEIDLEKKRHEAEDLRKDRDAARAEIETLRKELANAQRELSEQGQAHSVEQQQETADLREQLDAAQAAVTLQRATIERQSVCIGKVRVAQNSYQWPASWNKITAALAELDGEPTPVAERCPECDGSGMVDSGGFGPDGKGINVWCGGDCRGNPCPSQPAPVAEPTPCPECERLQAFVATVRRVDDAWGETQNVVDYVLGLQSALAELDAEGGA